MNLLQNFHLAVIEYLYSGRREIPLQTFSRHSNRKLSIVMALSTTSAQSASETTEFGKITQNKSYVTVQGHSRSPILVPIESSYTTSYKWLILTYLLSCTILEIQHSKGEKNRYISSPPLLRLNPPTERFPWDDLCKMFSECQSMVKVPEGEEKLPKISTGWVGCMNVTDRRQTERR